MICRQVDALEYGEGGRDIYHVMNHFSRIDRLVIDYRSAVRCRNVKLDIKLVFMYILKERCKS